MVTASILLRADGTWNSYICNKVVPVTCKALSTFPITITTPNTILDIIRIIDNAVLCPGNPEPHFIDIYKRKGGEVKGERGNGETVAFVDGTPVTTTSGEKHLQTLRRVDCQILSTTFGPCESCKSFRKTLWSALSRHRGSSATSSTSVSSHSKYSTLTSEEKDQRMSNLHRSLISSKQHCSVIEAKIHSLIESQSVSLQEDDSNDFHSIIDSVNHTVEERYPENSPQRLFWDQQTKFNSLKDKRQMRWHPLVLRFALNLKYMSTSAYKAVRQSGIIHLPSERTLSDYTHWSNPHTGVQLEYIEKLSTMLEDVPCGQRHCALLMDEMKIKSGLVFNKHSGTLVGFVDLGGVNRDIDHIVNGNSKPEDSSNGMLADQVLAFMARAVFKPSLSMPIAHFFSLSLKGMN